MYGDRSGEFVFGSKGLIERLNRGVTIFGDFPKRPSSVSDRKIDLPILGRRLPSGSTVSYSGTNSDGATDTFK